MKIVFINYAQYHLVSGVHIHFLARELTKLGHNVTAVVPFTTGNESQFGQVDYSLLDFNAFSKRLENGCYDSDTVLHAWTPRETPRILTQKIRKILGCRYYVHLEDNERRILESFFARPFASLVQEAARGKFDLDDSGLSHPILHQTFLAEASGVTVLMDKLAEFVPPGVPHQLIWPACEPAFLRIPAARSNRARRELGLDEDRTVMVYPGNVHHAVANSVSALYRALPLIAEAGFPVCLVRCAGSDQCLPCPEAGEIMARYGKYYRNVNPVDLPLFLSAADILVQPGAPDDFDEYRFPSKLPLFLASGRPVVLARANLGRFLTDGANCRILEQNTPEAIAGIVVGLLRDPAKAKKIGLGGREFARQNFDWRRSAETLLDFYEKTKNR